LAPEGTCVAGVVVAGAPDAGALFVVGAVAGALPVGTAGC
jgi:hypothetical protein